MQFVLSVIFCLSQKVHYWTLRDKRHSILMATKMQVAPFKPCGIESVPDLTNVAAMFDTNGSHLFFHSLSIVFRKLYNCLQESGTPKFV